jgi:hypothetical protein
MEFRCPECRAAWDEGATCEDAFYQMLYWENEQPDLGEVHHLMVLCFYLQHPSRMSPEGLAYQIQLLADFVEGGISPADVRRERSSQVDSGKRSWKVTARPGEAAGYSVEMNWKMTALDVVATGRDAYIESVRRWADLTHEAISHA